MNNKHHLKQPLVFKLAFFTAMFERFGFYILSFMLVLYVKSIYSMTDFQAFTLFGVFTGLVFLTPALGGYLADNIFGIRRCMILGLFCEALGFALLAIPYQFIFSAALSLIIIGVGLFKTAPTDLMARSYKDKDPRIDSGFTLFYMSINIGSFFSPIVAGIVQKYFGWNIAFLIASISLLCSLFFYFIFRNSAKDIDAIVGQRPAGIRLWIKVILGIAITSTICALLISHSIISNIVFIISTLCLLSYFLYEIYISPKEDKLKIIACLLLILIGMVFFILYFQIFTSMNLFIKRSVVRTIFGYNIPTIVFLSLNPFWILILSPILATVYHRLNRYGKNPAVTTKFPLGLLIISLCFFILSLSTHFYNQNGLVSCTWIIAALFLYSLGELLISALGVAMITHIAPKHMYGVMMGAWYLIATALAASISSLFANLASIPNNVTNPNIILHIYSSAFLRIGTVGIIATIIAFSISPYIKRFAQLN